MPLYPFRCEFCANYLEVERGIDEDVTNPACNYCGIQMTRVWSAPSIQFKGTGFYKTDNR